MAERRVESAHPRESARNRVDAGEQVRCTRVLRAGDGAWIPPGAVHATLNLSDADARFQVVGQPGLMTGYFVEAGVRVPDPHTPPDREPPGPAELRGIAARWGIEFWTGPYDTSAPDSSAQ